MNSKRDKRFNILLIMSDEHDPMITGCYNHPIIKTPNMDRLAADGIVFENAYCNSPMCVPSRLSFLTGRYPHRIDAWDNGSQLKAEIPTFAHYLEASGYDTSLCGRMDIIGADRLRGFGKRLFDDMESWNNPRRAATPRIRNAEARRGGKNSHVTECGPGTGSWQEYDETVTELSTLFLKNKAEYPQDKPWLLVTGLMFPHFPLIAPERFFNMYDPNHVIIPDMQDETFDTQHPVIKQLRRFFCNDEELPEELLRKALVSYYALISYTDYNIGRMLDIIDNSHLKENTVVIYTSDHGEMGGHHGIWQKQCFYENSVRVPLIMRIPGIKGNVRISTNVSLVDIMPTLLEFAEIDAPENLDGESLLKAIRGEMQDDRVIFSEYHAQGMLNAGFMVKKGCIKYNYYVGERPQLFDLSKDPGEFKDLAEDEKYKDMLEDMDKELHRILQPDEIDRRAKAYQEKAMQVN